MPGLMNRASTVVKARISKLLDRAEDPSITLDYSYEKQRELLQNVKRGVADVVTAKKPRLELQSQKLEQEIEKLETQARRLCRPGARTSPGLRSSAGAGAAAAPESRPTGHRARASRRS